MYLLIDVDEYRDLLRQTFAPQVDLSGDSLPINVFEVDVVTDDDISEGQYAELRDDLDNLWARYWITSAQRTSENVVHIKAQSEVALLDGVTLPATMFVGEGLHDVLDDTMVRQAGGGLVAIIDYDLDASLETVTVTGYCPEQTARERLLWLLLVSGAYLDTAFIAKPTIKPVDDTETLIPLDRTFWRPSVSYGDEVSAVRVTSYSFAMDPDAASSNTSYQFPLPWVATPQALELANPAAPADGADNVVEIGELYLINPSNASALLSRMAASAFNRVAVDLDVINNAQYKPGDRVVVYTSPTELISGYIETATFAFGLQARSTLHLTGVENVTGATLTVIYTSGGVELAREEYVLPEGHAYSVATRFLDIDDGLTRAIYRPAVASVSGTMPVGGTTATVACEAVLIYSAGLLTVNAVDAIELQESSGVWMGVIS